MKKIIYDQRYKLDEILPLLVNKRKIILDGEEIQITKCLKTFLKGTKCVICGAIGCYFKKAKHLNAIRFHLELYAFNNYGHEVLMTSDHIIPRVKGGGNGLYNRQPMCLKCNLKKGEEIK